MPDQTKTDLEQKLTEKFSTELGQTMQNAITAGLAKQTEGDKEANNLFANVQLTIAYFEAVHGGHYTIPTRQTLSDWYVNAGVPVYTIKRDKDGNPLKDKKGKEKTKENASYIRGRTVWNKDKTKKHFKGCDTPEKVSAAMPEKVKSFAQFKAWTMPELRKLTPNEKAALENMYNALATLSDFDKLSAEQKDAAKRSCEQTIRNEADAIAKVAKEAKAKKPNLGKRLAKAA